MKIPLYQVDAFTARLFAGNPAAVCPLDAWLPDAVMQAIAAENNLSETAFFVPKGNEYALRWFTPAVEVDLCGHATLASGHVVLNMLRPQAEAARFHTRSGVLTVTRGTAGRLTMEFPARPPKPVDRGLVELVADAIGQMPLEVLKADKIMAVLSSAAAVRATAPDFGKIRALEGSGLIITARAGAGERPADFVSRYFAPHAGIDEDPVTGSAHCLLAPYWAGRLRRSELHALQVSQRGGEIFCTVRGGRVYLSGHAVPFFEGWMHVPVAAVDSQAAE